MRLFLAFVIAALSAFGQGALPYSKIQFFDPNGRPLAGGWVYTYATGTTTPQATYTDYTLSVANSNPVQLDSGGYGAIYVLPAMYTVVLCKGGTGGASPATCASSGGTVIWTQNGIADQGDLLKARQEAQREIAVAQTQANEVFKHHSSFCNKARSAAMPLMAT